MAAMEHISRAVEWLAVGALLGAFVLAALAVGRGLWRGADGRASYRLGREIFGRGILASLEILVAADLIRTVAVQPTLENVVVLAIIVAVRVVLSFALDVEIEGVLPWRNRRGNPPSTGP